MCWTLAATSNSNMLSTGTTFHIDVNNYIVTNTVLCSISGDNQEEMVNAFASGPAALFFVCSTFWNMENGCKTLVVVNVHFSISIIITMFWNYTTTSREMKPLNSLCKFRFQPNEPLCYAKVSSLWKWWLVDVIIIIWQPYSTALSFVSILLHTVITTRRTKPFHIIFN